jgi:putative FmdB family regulatory protein
MPIYQYECAECGSFDVIRRMAERDSAYACPSCGNATSRTVTQAAMLSLMPQARRDAFATNERSAHEPASSKTLGGHRHGPGCGCGASKASMTQQGLKSLPGRRPWMISH